MPPAVVLDRDAIARILHGARVSPRALDYAKLSRPSAHRAGPYDRLDDQKEDTHLKYSYIVSKARGPGGMLLTLGTRVVWDLRLVTLDRMNHGDQSQMWAERPHNPADPGTFGLQNRAYGTWMYPRWIRVNVHSSEETPMIILLPQELWTSDLRTVSWHHDNVKGPYNALAWAKDWEKKINILGNGPYSENSKIAPWDWSGAADNELWRFWDATAAPRPGASILLTNFEHIVQLGATPERKVYMHSNKDTWETWAVEDAGGGQVYLRSAHGTYLGSRSDGQVYVTTNRDAWERWIISFNDGFRVQSAQWRLYLGSRPDGSVYTHSNCLSWERWWAPIVGGA